MEFISYLIDLFLHLDVHLGSIIQEYGAWTYAILFIVIFCETGLVVTPFLPGDSLLFAAGAFAAIGSIDVATVFMLICVAAVIGDTANYAIGKYFGTKAFERFPKILKKEYIDKTHRFYEKHGGKTIVLARFVPIVRTFAPFVAGVGHMSYRHFISYNVLGGILWAALFIFGGYFFGNLSFVKSNFSLVIIAIILLSVMPGVFEAIRSRRAARPDGASK